jgi:hypothetical protein
MSTMQIPMKMALRRTIRLFLGRGPRRAGA